MLHLQKGAMPTRERLQSRRLQCNDPKHKHTNLMRSHSNQVLLEDTVPYAWNGLKMPDTQADGQDRHPLQKLPNQTGIFIQIFTFSRIVRWGVVGFYILHGWWWVLTGGFRFFTRLNVVCVLFVQAKSCPPLPSSIMIKYEKGGNVSWASLLKGNTLYACQQFIGQSDAPRWMCAAFRVFVIIYTQFHYNKQRSAVFKTPFDV